MDIHKKIKTFRRKAGLTQVDFAAKLGVTQGLVAHYETSPGELGKSGNFKKSSKPEIEKLTLIADILNIDVVDLLNDAENIRKNIIKKELKNNIEKYIDYIPSEYRPKNIVYISKVDILVGAGSEGVFDLELFKNETKIAIDKSFIKGLNPDNLKLFEIIGDSMTPEYNEGDLAIVDMVNHRYNFNKITGIYVIRLNELVYIKRVEFLPYDNIKLISLNPKYGDIYPHKEGYECEILGKVCGRISYEIFKGLTF